MKKYFLTGLVTLLPLAVTVAVVRFIVNLLTMPFIDIVSHLIGTLPLPATLVHTISQILILIGLVLFILGLGIFGRWFLIHTLIKTSDRFLHKIPLVNKVYKTTKDIVTSLFAQDTKSFQQVVMVTFPNQNCYVIGLIARSAPNTCSSAMNEEMVSVFVPTTPNPTTGFLVMRPRKELILLDMASEDAIKYIVSCGVVPPEEAVP